MANYNVDFKFEWQPGMTFERLKVAAMLAAIVAHKGNKVRAAEALDISIRTLSNYVRKYPELKLPR